MKIFDCFTFFNELDLLEFRLKLLDDDVDYFVIVEADHTFSGNPKPYYFEENKERFSRWRNKIIYITLQLEMDGLVFNKVGTYTPEDGAFQLEYQQRNGIAHIKGMVADNDMVMIGDLDEMPDPLCIRKLAEISSNKGCQLTISMNMLFHYYYMNCQNEGFERQWNGTIFTNGRYFKMHTPQQIRNNRNHYQRTYEAGWHFSFLGGAEKIKSKIQSFAHTEFNRPDIVNDEHIIRVIENGEDIFNRPNVHYKFHALEEYPEHLQKLMRRYPQFIKELPGLVKVISGGQTGVDRLGLEVAKELGISTGGTAAKGYRTEKGFDVSLKRFGLTESPCSDYTIRTEKNVIDSDGTVLFGDMKSPGSKQTIAFLKKHSKPYKENPTSDELKKFIYENNIKVLNVAGNRESKLSLRQMEQYRQVLKQALKKNLPVPDIY